MRRRWSTSGSSDQTSIPSHEDGSPSFGSCFVPDYACICKFQNWKTSQAMLMTPAQVASNEPPELAVAQLPGANEAVQRCEVVRSHPAPRAMLGSFGLLKTLDSSAGLVQRDAIRHVSPHATSASYHFGGWPVLHVRAGHGCTCLSSVLPADPRSGAAWQRARRSSSRMRRALAPGLFQNDRWGLGKRAATQGMRTSLAHAPGTRPASCLPRWPGRSRSYFWAHVTFGRAF